MFVDELSCEFNVVVKIHCVAYRNLDVPSVMWPIVWIVGCLEFWNLGLQQRSQMTDLWVRSNKQDKASTCLELMVKCEPLFFHIGFSTIIYVTVNLSLRPKFESKRWKFACLHLNVTLPVGGTSRYNVNSL